MAGEQSASFLALRDRAYALLAAGEPVTEAVLLAHVYGGRPPTALQAQLVAPLIGDPRLERRADGRWAVSSAHRVTRTGRLDRMPLTVLALVASGPTPGRGRLVRLAALHIADATVVQRFSATTHPGRHVPQYVAHRLGMAPEVLNELPPFEAIVDDLASFLGGRPVVAQDARLTWAFIHAEARRVGRVLPEPVLVDANQLATRLLDVPGKPTLARLAAALGIGVVGIEHPDEEARVLGMVAVRLLALADELGIASLQELVESRSTHGPAPLRHGLTARALPDQPGVYILRDAEQRAVYVGKARRLRARLAAYVHRPLGATRRLEGLVSVVQTVDSALCATDLEALILEDREIRRLKPRFNTVRRQRTPRVWIRLPPPPAQDVGKRQPAARRLELSLGPRSADGDFVGPFRNETAAREARQLARQVFGFDVLRRADLAAYEARLRLAMDFLRGDQELGLACARAQKVDKLVKGVLAYDPRAVLLAADPREARYAVVRSGLTGLEAFVVDRGILRGWNVMADDDDSTRFVAALLADAEPRTEPEDVDVVLRWFGAQHPPARLVCLPDDGLATADAIEDAIASALSAREPRAAEL